MRGVPASGETEGDGNLPQVQLSRSKNFPPNWRVHFVLLCNAFLVKHLPRNFQSKPEIRSTETEAID
jgi:hypothetical protein